jgi:hypothetical protein
LLYGNEVVGTARFSPTINGELPVHQYVPTFRFPSPAQELSRGVIHPSHRSGIGALIFSRAIYTYFLDHPSNIVIDILITKHHWRTRGHLLRIGFVDTGLRYWDHRYGSESALLFGAEDAVSARLKDYLCKLQ